MAYIPHMSNTEKSTKDLIIDTLSSEWPLTIRRIQASLKKSHSKSISYQAIHQMVTELLSEKIIEKKGKEYLLSMDWLEQVHEFGKRAVNSYSEKKPMVLMDKNITQFKFDNLYEIFRFIIEGAEKKFFNMKSPVMCAHLNHLPTPFTSSLNDYRLLRKLTGSGKLYYLCKNDTPLDRFVAKFHKSLNMNIKLGVKTLTKCDVYSLGDSVLQTFYPQNLMENIDKLYNETKSILNFNVVKFYKEVIFKKSNLIVVLTRNRELVKQIQAETLGYFKN